MYITRWLAAANTSRVNIHVTKIVVQDEGRGRPKKIVLSSSFNTTQSVVAIYHTVWA